MYIQAIFGPIVRRSNSACRRLSYMPPAASQSQATTLSDYVLMSNVCVKWLVATRPSPPPLPPPPPAAPAPQVLYQTYAGTVYKPSSWDLTPSATSSRLLATKKWRQQELLGKWKNCEKKCRLETAATVLFRVVLALSGKCFIIVCAFTRDQNHVEKRIKIRFYQ